MKNDTVGDKERVFLCKTAKMCYFYKLSGKLTTNNMKDTKKYNWEFCSVGGVVRVKISNGEDLAHLGELDQKLWTVLSCPVKGLEFDSKTLELLDSDADGKIRVPEVVAAAEWLTSVIKDKDSILKGEKSLALSNINTDTEEGQKLQGSARQILTNLGLEKDALALEDIEDTTKIFAGSKANGDGVITAASADDEALKELIAKVIAAVGSTPDRSGDAGVTAEQVEAFYAAAQAYADWQAAADEAVLPYGDATEAACAAVEAIASKVKDFFMRCKLIAFDGDAAGAVDVSVDAIGAIAGGNLSEQEAAIAQYPLARPSVDRLLPLDSVNPAWKAAVDAVAAAVPELADKKSVSEDEWDAIVAKFGSYNTWKAAKAGAEVEPLGLDEVKAILAAGQKQALLDLIEADKAVEAEANGIDEACKLVRYYAHFAKLLKNYVTMSDFYTRRPDDLDVFEVGKLYVDERCCDLCIRVADMGAHADMAAQSGMFLIYCTCTSKVKNETMDIVAAMTAGTIRNLRPGKNGIFYDRQGQDWDAVITKVVDNPVSVSQAFWSPYRKFAKFISDKIDKSAADKDAAATSNLLAKADGGAKQPFDISKFAGIFAAVGLAIGALGAGLGLIIAAIKGLAWWKYLVIIAVIMLVISGPACFIAWRKLRKRNLGPVLNANGWAVNSAVLVNNKFGRTLTSVARYPKYSKGDPYATPAWKKWLFGILASLVAAFVVLYFTNCLACIGLPHEKKADVVEVEAEAPVEEAAAEAEAAIEEIVELAE